MRDFIVGDTLDKDGEVEVMITEYLGDEDRYTYIDRAKAMEVILRLASVFKITDKEITVHFTNGG